MCRKVYSSHCQIFLVTLVVFTVCISVCAQKTNLLKQFESKLAYQEKGGIFDFGEHLKDKGKRELSTLADEFQNDELRLWIVTLPKEYPANSAERLYSNLSLTEKDVLIVFNSQQVYGKTLALKGEKELFTKYLDESRRYFNQYWAKGLAHYATLIKDRIIEKRKRKQFHHNLLLFSALGIAVAGVLTVVVVIFVIRGQSRKAYQEKLSRADLLFGEIGENISEPGTEKYTDRFLELSERMEKLKSSKKNEIEEVDSLISDMESLLSELEEDNTTQK